jgi:hypothetical protein
LVGVFCHVWVAPGGGGGGGLGGGRSAPRPRHYHAYHYLVTVIATSRKLDLLALLLSLAADERDPRKVGHLVEALSLVRGDKGVEQVMSKLSRA